MTQRYLAISAYVSFSCGVTTHFADHNYLKIVTTEAGIGLRSIKKQDFKGLTSELSPLRRAYFWSKVSGRLPDEVCVAYLERDSGVKL